MIRGGLLVVAALAASPALAAPPAPVELTAPGPEGPLAGTLLDPDGKAPLVLLIPGSGPTDRDGNNPLGVAGGPYRQLAEALAANGIGTLRIDKRGLFGSKAMACAGRRTQRTPRHGPQNGRPLKRVVSNIAGGGAT